MSFKQNSMINLGNYEEYFILYMDNELSATEKLMVENFIAQHPHLAEELDILMGTKLPLDTISFEGKEELLASSMKINTVDEALLLYIDKELAAAEIKVVEQKISSDKDYALQHAVLMQTKLNASEKITHPNKKELYRRTEKTIAFNGWMRIAAAVIVLLFGSLFFLLNKEKEIISPTTAGTNSPVINAPVIATKPSVTGKPNSSSEAVMPGEMAAVKSPEDKPQHKTVRQDSPAKELTSPQETALTTDAIANAQQERKRDVIQFDVKQFTQPQIGDLAVKETLAHNPVTSALPDRTTIEDAQEPADPSGDFKNTKKSSAKGLFRKVTRFIGRNTGIGTADVGEEVLIGAVALKLK